MRACARARVTPDVVLLFDPQYWNYLHVARAVAPHALLITDISVFPAVFRLPWEYIVLAGSACPFATSLAHHDASCSPSHALPLPFVAPDLLASGGSVATSAWECARYLGATTIVYIGLDLAFPGARTHFRGALFEERAHLQSGRVAPAETTSFCALHSLPLYPVPAASDPHPGKNSPASPTGENKEQTVLTDARFSLYAVWLEAHLARYTHIKTYALEPAGRRVAGITPLRFSQLVTLLNRSAAVPHCRTMYSRRHRLYSRYRNSSVQVNCTDAVRWRRTMKSTPVHCLGHFTKKKKSAEGARNLWRALRRADTRCASPHNLEHALERTRSFLNAMPLTPTTYENKTHALYTALCTLLPTEPTYRARAHAHLFELLTRTLKFCAAYTEKEGEWREA
ncbi:6-hydroxymethylpterin diphosphokinase MptE-like protein [Treponema pallidum]|uniref:6-hydroxymethylpterin diphosphokinase MptE-like protein n=1 Tax=Treponema pallidum TaxID=160 RepID=UPI00244E94B5|nr:DUF115 domain-containing protein [Treponema pallidum]